MARKALILKCKKRQARAKRQRDAGVPVTESTKIYNRCSLCGRNRGYMNRFDMCRICFRERANKGEILGVRKASW